MIFVQDGHLGFDSEMQLICSVRPVIFEVLAPRVVVPSNVRVRLLRPPPSIVPI